MSESNDNESQKLLIVDTTRSLTLEEFTELKKLAGISKTTRLFLGLLFAFVTITGLPVIMTWLQSHTSFIHN